MSLPEENALARRAIYRLLEHHLEHTPEGVKYIEESNSDALIAERIKIMYPQSDINTSKVAGIRLRSWGQLVKPIPIEEQLELLKKENAALKEIIKGFTPKNIVEFSPKQQTSFSGIFDKPQEKEELINQSLALTFDTK